MPPARKLKPLHKSSVAQRVCDLVNARFGGNLSEAARVWAVDYDQLRNTCLGMLMRGPSVELLVKIAAATDQTVDQLLGVARPAVPADVVGE